MRIFGDTEEEAPKRAMTVAELSKAIEDLQLKEDDRINLVLMSGMTIGNAIYFHYDIGPGFKSGPFAQKSELMYRIDDQTTGVDNFGVRRGLHPVRNTELVKVERVQAS